MYDTAQPVAVCFAPRPAGRAMHSTVSEVRSRKKPRDKLIVHSEPHDNVNAWFSYTCDLCDLTEYIYGDWISACETGL
jgi:hypothetical protein